MFVLAGYSGKLKNKKLSDYLISAPAKRAQTPDEMIGTLEILRDMGAPMTIREVN